MDWNDLKYFSSVARTGSLTKTGEEFHVSPSTVARRVTALEHTMGFSLFIRHQTGYFLTDAARAIQPRIAMIENDMQLLTRITANMDLQLSGIVHIATAETLAIHIIIPALVDFYALYPDIRIELVTGVSSIGLTHNGVDIAVRLVRPDKGNFIIKKIGEMHSSLFGSSHYLERYPVDHGLSESVHGFIGWNEHYAYLTASKWLTDHHPYIPVVLRTTSLLTQLKAVQAGLGLAVLPNFLIQDHHDLVDIIPIKEVFSENIWLLTHKDLRASIRIRVVMDFLSKVIGEKLS